MKVKASYHQERLWFIDEFEAGNLYDSNPLYHNIPLVLDISGEVHADILEQSFQDLIRRHEALHTKIITVNNEPVQWIDPEIDFKLELVDLQGKSEGKEEPGKDPVSLALERVKRPFAMAKELLIRGTLIQVTGKKYMLAIGIHHVISDRFSLGIFFNELMEYYDAHLNKRLPRLPELPLHYADFSQWQHELSPDQLDTLLFYWKRQLGGELQALELPTDHPRASVHIFREGTQPFNLSSLVSKQVKDFARRKGVSCFVVLVAAFKTLLHRYCGQEEIIIGTSANERNQPGTENIIGPIANLLVLRTRVSGTSTFNKILQNAHKTVKNAFKYRDLPFDKLVQELDPEKDMSRTALFDILFQYEENPVQTYKSKHLILRVVETNLGWGKYDLNLLVQGGDIFTGALVYNSCYYEDATISRFIDHYSILLEKLVVDPAQEISRLPFLTEKEKQRLLIEWNQTQANYPKNKTIHKIFEELAAKNPDHIAVTAIITKENISISYMELERKSNQLAYLLKDRGIKPDTIAAIMMERSVEMIIGILGILKAGGAYLPLDPDYPPERIHFMLKDSSAKVLLKKSESPRRGHPIKNPNDKNSNDQNMLNVPIVLNFEHLDFEFVSDLEFRASNLSPSGLAYIIYTSGTTGVPKGCLISHRNVVRLIKNDIVASTYRFARQDVWIMAHSICFDFSVWEIYGALLNGGRLILPDWEIIRDMGLFLSIIEKQCVTILNQTPLSFYQFIEAGKESAGKSLDKHLRYVFFGGDRLSPVYLQDWAARYSLTDILLINMFGITETTVHVTHYVVKEEDILSSEQASPIGGPLPETFIYIFDIHLNLVPVGVVGEMYIGGTGVARGYLNRVKLTKERFIENPYKKGEILYKSGDLGKWLPTGTIQYMGRNDFQVKIRGYRIELGEIECRLSAYEHIREVVVIPLAANGGEIDLCAYFVSDTGLRVSELRDYLTKELPDYMTPTYFMQVDRIPLTSNGKVDRRSLPDPYESINTGVEYVEPQNDVEQMIADTWKEILKLDKVSIHDNFFELGGNSIKIMHVIGKLKELFHRDFPVLTMFRYTTIESFARYIIQGETEADSFVLKDERQAAGDKKRKKLKDLKSKMKVN